MEMMLRYILARLAVVGIMYLGGFVWVVRAIALIILFAWRKNTARLSMFVTAL